MKHEDFNKVYEQHAELVYRFLLRLCGDAHLAEDLMQDTFLKAMQNVDSFDNRCKFTTWLCQIAKNTYYDNLRKKKNHPMEALSEEMESGQSFEEKMINDEAAREIRRLIHRLPETYKEVFLLRFYGELSFREIGEIFEKSEGWGRVTYLRSREMLKTYLTERNE